MPRGTGYRRFVNRAPVLPQPSAVISGGDGGDAAFRALTVASSQLGAVAFQETQRQIQQAETTYLASAQTDAQRTLLELRDQHSDDPVAYKDLVTSYRSKTLQGMADQPEHVRERVGVLIDSVGTQHLGAIYAARRAKDDRNALQSFNSGYELTSQQLVDFAATGNSGAPEYQTLLEQSTLQINDAVADGTITPERGALLTAERDQGLIGADISYRAERIRAEQGPAAAQAYLEREVRNNEALGLSRGTRHALYGQALDKVDSAQAAEEGRATVLAGRVNAMTGRYDRLEIVTPEQHELLSRQLAEAGSFEELSRLHGARELAKIKRNYISLPLDQRDEYLQGVLEDLRVGGQFGLPVVGGVETSQFGLRLHPIDQIVKQHNGVDLAAPKGTPVHATRAGRVVSAGKEGGYGNRVVIDHGNGVLTGYAHLDAFAEGLKPGDTVEAGQNIGAVGSTGKSTGPHLHYDMRINGEFVDPLEAGPELSGSDVRLTQDVKQLLAINTREQFAPVLYQWGRGIKPSRSELAEIVEQAELSGAVDVLLQIERMTAIDKRLAEPGGDPGKIAQERAELVAQMQAEGLDVVEAAVLQGLETLEAQAEAAIRVDPMQYALQLDEVAPDAIDWEQPLEQLIPDLELRADLAATTEGRWRAQYDLPPVVPFTAIEMRALGQTWDRSSANERGEILGILTRALPIHQAQAVFAKLAGERPVAAVAGMVQLRDPITATGILRGEEIIAADPKALAKDQVLRAAFDQGMGRALTGPSGFRARNAAFAAVVARYADLAFQSNKRTDSTRLDFDKALFERAIDEVVGIRVSHRSAGIGSGSAEVVAPPGWTEDQFDAAIEALTDEDFSGTATLSGQQVTAEDFRDHLHLVDFGPGRYHLETDERLFVSSPSGEAFVLDLRNIPTRRPKPVEVDAPTTEARSPAKPEPLNLPKRPPKSEAKLVRPDRPTDVPSSVPGPAVSAEGGRLQFGPGSSDLTAIDKEALDQLIDALSDDETSRIEITAFASGREDDSSVAQRLSLARALAVRNYLLSRGVKNSSRFVVRSRGDNAKSGPADRVDLRVR